MCLWTGKSLINSWKTKHVTCYNNNNNINNKYAEPTVHGPCPNKILC